MIKNIPGADLDFADAFHGGGNHEPAPPDAPKPKPSPNPKQPDSTANLGNFGLHSTRTTLRTSSLYWVQESLGSRTEMQTLIKEAWDTRPEILHLQ
ncbi:uncharacterized protein LOC103880626 isoform X8 [Papio anubis]|uniref:uncharacterized protein LOC103880626 isoform X8 n=1 Tax=Papio anubis TaxID=9555 RepID=UPI0012ADFDCC|nr:uncharacterized protein LOC103880626 isoform X8 [Papio anubis]